MSARRNPFAHLDCAALSDMGRKRKNNEDAAASFPSRGVWCVADGMGGGDDGEIASGAVVRAIDACLAGIPLPDDGAYSADSIVRAISRAVNDASAWISDRAIKKGLDGCGSTVVGCVFDPTCPGTALAFHVGDSRLYRLHGRDIRQITKDHSVEEMMGVKDGKRLNPMFRGMILRAVGIERSVEIEVTRFPVHEGDVVLICSDGLSRMVSDKKMSEIVREAEEDMGVAATNLVEAANEAGGVDNITVSLVHVGALPPACAAVALPNEAAMSGDTVDSISHEYVEPGVIPYLCRNWRRLALEVGAILVVAALATFLIASFMRNRGGVVVPEPSPSQAARTEPRSPVAATNEAASAAATNDAPAGGASCPQRAASENGREASPLAAETVVTNDAAVARTEPRPPVAVTNDVAVKKDAPLFTRRREEKKEETPEERERREAREELEAMRQKRAKAAELASAHENERLAIARELAKYYYRDEFAAFAGAAKRILDKDYTGRVSADGDSAKKLLMLGSALYQHRNDETVGVAAAEFTMEACFVASNVVANVAAGRKISDGEILDITRHVNFNDFVGACRKFAECGFAASGVLKRDHADVAVRTEPRPPDEAMAQQKAFLELLKLFSAQRTEDHGRSR